MTRVRKLAEPVLLLKAVPKRTMARVRTITDAEIERELALFETAIKKDGLPFNPEYLWGTMKQFEGEMKPAMLLALMVVASATEHPGQAPCLTNKQFMARLAAIRGFLRLVARAGWIKLAENVLRRMGLV
ncbi:MAG: hypothetical protein NTAFB01_21090 [Nitrospira sp.]